MNCVIRAYTPEDRRAVRHICCETGFMGNPVDPLFSDREAFADFFTRYYTDCEPQNGLVAESDGRVVGYLISCLDYHRYPMRQFKIILCQTFPRMLARILTGRYKRQDFRFLSWFLVRSASETPKAPNKSAHFHINLLPEFRRSIPARKLIFTFINELRRKGVQQVYGQIQTFDNRRPTKVFERYGFEPFDRREITKFRRFRDEPVYVSTFCKQIEA